MVLSKIFGDRPDPAMTAALQEKLKKGGEWFEEMVQDAGQQASQAKHGIKDRVDDAKRAITGGGGGGGGSGAGGAGPGALPHATRHGSH